MELGPLTARVLPDWTWKSQLVHSAKRARKSADSHVKYERMGFHCTARVCKGRELAEPV